MITAGDSAVGRSWAIEGEAEEEHSSWRKQDVGALTWERFGFFSGREGRTVWLEPHDWEAGRG